MRTCLQSRAHSAFLPVVWTTGRSGHAAFLVVILVFLFLFLLTTELPAGITGRPGHMWVSGVRCLGLLWPATEAGLAGLVELQGREGTCRPCQWGHLPPVQSPAAACLGVIPPEGGTGRNLPSSACSRRVPGHLFPSPGESRSVKFSAKKGLVATGSWKFCLLSGPVEAQRAHQHSDEDPV